MSTKADVCLTLAHKTKELETRAALLEFAYEFRTVAKWLERDERKLMVRAASDGTQNHGYKRLGRGWVESDLPMKTKTHFAFRVDIWDHAGDSPQNQNI
jgi:hypothetical protein